MKRNPRRQRRMIFREGSEGVGAVPTNEDDEIGVVVVHTILIHTIPTHRRGLERAVSYSAPTSRRTLFLSRLAAPRAHATWIGYSSSFDAEDATVVGSLFSLSHGSLFFSHAALQLSPAS